jgi:uncharacterized membrane protein YjgN (DUF898 family)
MNRFVCFGCGFSVSETDVAAVGALCPTCNDHLQLERPARREAPAAEAASAAGSLVRPRTRRLRPSFAGSGVEYFKVWIVNIFLTVVTAGIYTAWAKVRKRLYFYKNTLLDGHAFDYTANPLAIFKGYLLIGGSMLLYYGAQYLDPVLSLVLALIFACVFPFLVYKSLRFSAHHSKYRNVRFRFLGTVGESYKTYLLFPILIPFTLGLIFPYLVFRQKKYFFDNMAFGTARNTFEGRPGPFYKVYIVAGVLFIAAIFGTVMAMSVFLPVLGGLTGNAADDGGGSPFPPVAVIGMMVLIYVAMLFLGTLFQQYIYAWTTNYCWGHSRMGDVRFQSTLRAGKLFWIRVTNILAIIFSVGLLIPWAHVRRTRYIMSNLTIMSGEGLDSFAAASGEDESAYGEAAADFFDLEIGL